MLAYLVEFLGTFLFLSVIIATGNIVLISLALLFVLYLGTSISGGHYNPAVSVMFWAKGALTNTDLLGYVVAQISAGLLALATYKTLYKSV